MMADLLSSARNYFNQYGWVTHPLGMDANNLPKRPLTKDWTNIEASMQAIESLDWGSAKGMGLITGSKSGIGVIDVDDKDLALVLPLLWDHYPLMVSTARNRGHVYVLETDGSSGSSKFFVTYRGRDVGIELKGNGTQVAMPPTENYQWLRCTTHHDHERGDPHNSTPLKAFSLASAWEFIMDCINYEFGEGTIHMKESMPDNAGYPKVWADHVAEGTRNDSVYVEAHRLRRSGCTEEQAVDIMLRRVDLSYEGGMTEDEIKSTVYSAFKNGGRTTNEDSRPRFEDLFGQQSS
jgi:hypothetical protein